jgi:hypothetical protein
LIQNTTDTPHDDMVEVMAAQTRAWIEQSHAFGVLGRYETRLSRQILKYTEEFERIQKERIARERAEREDPRGKRHENKRDQSDLASFGRTAPEMVMSANSFRVPTQLPIDSPVNDAPPAQPEPNFPARFPEAA